MIWALAVGLVLLLFWLFVTARRISASSSGPGPVSEASGEALLLIDAQQAFWTEEIYPAEALARAERRIKSEAERLPLIAVRQEWSGFSMRLLARLTMGGRALAGQPDTKLAPVFEDLPAHEIVKPVQDAFSTGALDDLAKRLGIRHLVIAGLDGNHCVKRTAESALARGYRVTLITDAILSANGDAFEEAKATLAARGANLA